MQPRHSLGMKMSIFWGAISLSCSETALKDSKRSRCPVPPASRLTRQPIQILSCQQQRHPFIRSFEVALYFLLDESACF